MTEPPTGVPPSGGSRCFVDLHCHTRGSFDSLSSPASVVQAAARRGITHLAITDHDRIDAAIEARDVAPPGLTVIVGEEVRSADCDLIGLYLSEPVPPGMSAAETIAAIHGQGGLAGAPHPFDTHRGSAGKRLDVLEAIVGDLDFVEAYNARVVLGGGSGNHVEDRVPELVGDANEKAAAFARIHDVPGIAASDAHTAMEVGISYAILPGPIDEPQDLVDALRAGPPELVRQRASYLVRLVTPVAKVVQRFRGNGRVAWTVTS